MIKAVIYDMDDLMVNSDPLHARSWKGLLKRHGHSFGEISEEKRMQYLGMRVIDIAKDILKTLKIDADIDEFYKERIDVFLELVKKELKAMPGLVKSLKLFKENGFKIALASSGARKYIDLVLDKFKIRNYFDVAVSGDDVEIGKPDPETYLVASKKLGFNPGECLVLEDATKGIESAKSARCKCIAIKNPNTPPQDRSGADKVLNSLNEVTLDVIESLQETDLQT